MAHPHMAFTAPRPGTADDSARALAVVEKLRAAIAPYQTLEDAEKAGYRSRRDAETVKGGRLLHVAKWPKRRGQARPSIPRPRRPCSTAEAATASSIWPAECSWRRPSAGPGRPRRDDSAERGALAPAHQYLRHRQPEVVQAGAEGHHPEACQEAGGRFRAESRYMVHVMTDAGSNLAMAFPQGRDEMGAMDMGPGHEH